MCVQARNNSKKYYNTTKYCIPHVYNIAKKGDRERDSISGPVFNFLLYFTVPDVAGKPQVIIHPPPVLSTAGPEPTTSTTQNSTRVVLPR